MADGHGVTNVTIDEFNNKEYKSETFGSKLCLGYSVRLTTCMKAGLFQAPIHPYACHQQYP
jgi:hypothetical protein